MCGIEPEPAVFPQINSAVYAYIGIGGWRAAARPAYGKVAVGV